MNRIFFIIITLCVSTLAAELPQLQKRGKCMFFIGIEKYIQNSIDVSVSNNTLYLKGIEDLQKEGDPYFYYKFDIPQECKGKPMLGFTQSGINVLLKG
jgi:hypothetical protein